MSDQGDYMLTSAANPAVCTSTPRLAKYVLSALYHLSMGIALNFLVRKDWAITVVRKTSCKVFLVPFVALRSNLLTHFNFTLTSF